MHVRRWATIVLLAGVLVHPSAAQTPVGETAKGEATQRVTDPLGRTTPLGSIAAFVYSVDREDFDSAAKYLQLTTAQREHAETLARDLKLLMDRYLSEPLTDISDSPEGALNDGLPVDRERIGPLVIDGTKTYITLVR